MDYTDLEAIASAKRAQAYARLNERVRVGASLQEVAIKSALATVIVDRIWYPPKMSFSLSVPNSNVGALRVMYKEDHQVFRLHNHALGQMASIFDIARTYITKLREGTQWKKELLVHILNEHFSKEVMTTAKGEPLGYLRRAVDNEIRGFQGRSFGRSMATAPLLRTFVEECGRFRAGPLEAHTTDIMTTLKCVLPFIFEPIAGEFVAFGISFSNSDFGAGKLAVAGLVLRISSGGIAVTENALNKIHIGKVISADEEFTVSEETTSKELEAHKSAIKDVVASVVSPESVKRSLDLIVLASKHKIEWYKLRTSLSKALSKKELELVKTLLEQGDDLMDLPPIQGQRDEERVATKWWAANVVGWFAGKEENAERRHELQELAGELLT